MLSLHSVGVELAHQMHMHCGEFGGTVFMITLLQIVCILVISNKIYTLLHREIMAFTKFHAPGMQPRPYGVTYGNL